MIYSFKAEKEDEGKRLDAFAAEKPVTGKGWACGFASPSLYAAFPHLYFAGKPELAVRFVQAAARYQPGQRERKGQG